MIQRSREKPPSRWRLVLTSGELRFLTGPNETVALCKVLTVKQCAFVRVLQNENGVLGRLSQRVRVESGEIFSG